MFVGSSLLPLHTLHFPTRGQGPSTTTWIPVGKIPPLPWDWGKPALDPFSPSVMVSNEALTLFLLHPPFRDQVGFLPASFHFQGSVEAKEEGGLLMGSPCSLLGSQGG